MIDTQNIPVRRRTTVKQMNLATTRDNFLLETSHNTSCCSKTQNNNKTRTSKLLFRDSSQQQDKNKNNSMATVIQDTKEDNNTADDGTISSESSGNSGECNKRSLTGMQPTSPLRTIKKPCSVSTPPAMKKLHSGGGTPPTSNSSGSLDVEAEEVEEVCPNDPKRENIVGINSNPEQLPVTEQPVYKLPKVTGGEVSTFSSSAQFDNMKSNLESIVKLFTLTPPLSLSMLAVWHLRMLHASLEDAGKTCTKCLRESESERPVVTTTYEAVILMSVPDPDSTNEIFEIVAKAFELFIVNPTVVALRTLRTSLDSAAKDCHDLLVGMANPVVPATGTWDKRECKMFMLGLETLGLGSGTTTTWPKIAREYVRTRTTVQVRKHFTGKTKTTYLSKNVA
jgi:hypothetical protein